MRLYIQGIKLRFILLHCLIPLVIGSMIYAAFRPEHFLSIEQLQGSVPSKEWPLWIRFHLADGLWMYAFFSAIKVIWYDDIFNLLLWGESTVLLTLILEFSQFSEKIPGTFDWYDVLAYLVAILLCQMTYLLTPAIQNQ